MNHQIRATTAVIVINKTVERSPMNDAAKKLIDAFLPYCKPAERSTWERIRDLRDPVDEPSLNDLLLHGLRTALGWQIRGTWKGGRETDPAKIENLLALAKNAGVSL